MSISDLGIQRNNFQLSLSFRLCSIFAWENAREERMKTNVRWWWCRWSTMGLKVCRMEEREEKIRERIEFFVSWCLVKVHLHSCPSIFRDFSFLYLSVNSPLVKIIGIYHDRMRLSADEEEIDDFYFFYTHFIFTFVESQMKIYKKHLATNENLNFTKLVF
jgi:hypothetical protein